MLPITAEREKVELFDERARHLNIRKGLDFGSSEKMLLSRQYDTCLEITEWERTLAGISELIAASRSSRLFRSSALRTNDNAQAPSAESSLTC